MSPVVCPSNTLHVSKDAPAALSLRAKVCFRSCTRMLRKPSGAGSPSSAAYFAAARLRADCQPELCIVAIGLFR